MLLRGTSQSGFKPAPATITISKKFVCPGDNGGILLSPAFCATIFADNVGHVRHTVIGPNGVLYVNTWSTSLQQ
jgi:hypothetical protein